MAELGSGNGSDYPSSLDTDNTKESTSTLARSDVPNDSNAAIIAIETELGVDPAGTKNDVKTFLQVEHNTNGKHGTITTDVINEQSGGAGVTIDDLTTDTIVESTGGAGVTVDGCLIKDGAAAKADTVSNNSVTEIMLANFVAGSAVMNFGLEDDVETNVTVSGGPSILLRCRCLRIGSVRMSLTGKYGLDYVRVDFRKNDASQDTQDFDAGYTTLTYDMTFTIGDWLEIRATSDNDNAANLVKNPKLRTDIVAFGAFVTYDPT